MFNNNLTTLLKSIIQNLGLINTGKLYNSIFVSVEVRDKIYIDIKCEKYFPYLLNEYNIINLFTNNSIFTTEIEAIYQVIFDEMINNLIKEETIPNELLLPVILINGF